MSLADRAALTMCPVVGQLLQLMSDKESLLCVALDVSEASVLLRLAAAVGPHAALLKTHSDMVSDWTPETASQLRQLAKQHNFLVMEDRWVPFIVNLLLQKLVLACCLKVNFSLYLHYCSFRTLFE